MTQEELITRYKAESKERDRQSDRELASLLLKEIPRYHKLYAKYKHAESLDCARDAGILLDKLYKKWITP